MKLLKIFSTFLFIFLVANFSYAQNKSNLFYKNGSQKYIDLSLNESDSQLFDKILLQLKDQDWSKALSLAGSMKDDSFRDTMTDYVLWKKFSNLDTSKLAGEFADLTDFIQKNPFLPNIQDLRLKAEDIYIKEGIPYIYAQKYFQRHPPIQTDALLKILKDRLIFIENEIISDANKINLITDFNQSIKDIWLKQNFNLTQEQEFLNLFGQKLSDGDYISRIEYLIWNERYVEAGRLLQFLDTEHKILYKSILAINENPKYINNLLRSIPKEFRENELLLYARAKYYHKYKKQNEIFKIFYVLPESMSHHQQWWKYRKFYSREFIKTRDWKKAYYLVSNHNLESQGEDFAEAEWLSGWLALRFLKQPELAYQHFYKLYSNVKYPISLSKASYWAGRALQESGKEEKALYWYHISAKYPTYFYGQLGSYAKYEILSHSEPTEESHLPPKPQITAEDIAKVKNDRMVKLAYLTAVLEEDIGISERLFRQAIWKTSSKSQVAVILNIIKSIENEKLTTVMTKYATNKDVFFIEDLYPVLKIVNKDNPNVHLIHAIIKQESGFHVSAKSSAGAVGFMQLMPQTAKSVCRRIGVNYSKQKLSQDPEYNILLGSTYISSLLKQFQGSEILAIASYNAGPNAVQRWIKLFGDPREYKDIKDIVDWLELITYSETRNYVQRIIENSIVYEYVLESEDFGYKSFGINVGS